MGRVVAVVAALGVLGWVAAPVVLGGGSCDEVGRLPTASFIGAVVERDGDLVTYEVGQPVTIEGIVPNNVAAGDRVVITYGGGEARFLHRGGAYRVDAFGADQPWRSGIAQARECPEAEHGSGTVHADGSSIDTGLLTRDGIGPYVGRVVLTTILLLAASAVALVLWRRHQRPRLTIDGRPLP